jgi:hypothetical protein
VVEEPLEKGRVMSYRSAETNVQNQFMCPRFHPEKMASQIVFDITGGEKQLQTMTLATIPNKPHLIKNEKDSYLLKVDDIEGARYVPPTIHPRDTHLDIADIDGARVKPMVNPDRPAVDIMAKLDIPGSKPRIFRQLPHSNRMVNPVDPKYDLPSFNPPKIPPPPFIRDKMYNDDVEGAHPMSYKSDKPPKDIMMVDDIPGTRPVRQIRELQGIDTLCVKDINSDRIFKSSRRVDPLNPVYEYDGMEKRPDDFGKVRAPLAGHSGPDRIMDITDIEGTHSDASTKRHMAFRHPRPPVEAEAKPAEILMIPSMKKQTKELEMQQAARTARGEKIRYYENRNLHAEMGTGDPIQAALRRQREERKKKCRHQTF